MEKCLLTNCTKRAYPPCICQWLVEEVKMLKGYVNGRETW